nr:MAG TPA: hypothetical protein [Caudoviricetes sp.]
MRTAANFLAVGRTNLGKNCYFCSFKLKIIIVWNILLNCIG